MWKVGQKVVCISDDYTNPRFGGRCRVGDIRTVAGWRGNHFTTIEEGVDPENPRNPAYHFKRFAPLEPRRDADTDELIRQFTVPETIDAPFVPQIKKPQTA